MVNYQWKNLDKIMPWINNFFKKRPKKVAVALSGGTARGLAHIGVLSVLEKYWDHIDLIVGTSAGAIVGSVWALGLGTQWLEEFTREMTWKNIMDFKFSKMAFNNGKRLKAMISKVVRGLSFQDMKKSMAVVSTDIEALRPVVHTNGNLVECLRASSSIPGIYSPVKIDGKLLVDGAVLNAVPVNIARALGADYVIAVDVGYSLRKMSNVPILPEIVYRSFQAMGQTLSDYQVSESDIVIKPQLPGIEMFDFKKVPEIIDKGKQAAISVIESGILKKIGVY